MLYSEGSLWCNPKTISLGKKLHASNIVSFKGLYTHEGVTSYGVQGEENIKSVCDETVERILPLATK